MELSWFPIGFLGCPWVSCFWDKPIYSNPKMTVATVAKGLAWIVRNKKADTTLAPNSLQSRKFITHQSPSLHEGQTRPIFVIKLYHLLIIHISSLPEGKDSLFRWPSDDKRKSEGPGSEKQVDQLERIAKISKEFQGHHGKSGHFFVFLQFQQISTTSTRCFPWLSIQPATKCRENDCTSSRLWQRETPVTTGQERDKKIRLAAELGRFWHTLPLHTVKTLWQTNCITLHWPPIIDANVPLLKVVDPQFPRIRVVVSSSTSVSCKKHQDNLC